MPDHALSDNPYTAIPAGTQSAPKLHTVAAYIGEKRTYGLLIEICDAVIPFNHFAVVKHLVSRNRIAITEVFEL